MKKKNQIKYSSTHLCMLVRIRVKVYPVPGAVPPCQRAKHIAVKNYNSLHMFLTTLVKLFSKIPREKKSTISVKKSQRSLSKHILLDVTERSITHLLLRHINRLLIGVRSWDFWSV